MFAYSDVTLFEARHGAGVTTGKDAGAGGRAFHIIVLSTAWNLVSVSTLQRLLHRHLTRTALVLTLFLTHSLVL